MQSSVALILVSHDGARWLPTVIDGKGNGLRNDTTNSIKVGESANDWKLFPRPKDMDGGRIQLYVPAMGVLTIPVSA